MHNMHFLLLAQIMWSAHSTHRNPKYFPDPHKFDPSRFEGAGPAPFTFVPFGGGPRMCPGNEFARMEILIIIHRLVTQFSWILKDPNEAMAVDLPCHYLWRGFLSSFSLALNHSISFTKFTVSKRLEQLITDLGPAKQYYFSFSALYSGT